MSAVSDGAHRLWVAMWSRASSDGVFRRDPRALARRVLRIDSAADVAVLLAELEQADLLDACPRCLWRGIQLRNRAGVPCPTSQA